MTKPSEKTPERIWLLLGEGDEGSHLWCDDPDPSGNGETQSVEYVRADVAKAIPSGWKLVPIKPTQQMIDTAVRYGDSEGYGRVSEIDVEMIWEDMLAATPKPE